MTDLNAINQSFFRKKQSLTFSAQAIITLGDNGKFGTPENEAKDKNLY